MGSYVGSEVSSTDRSDKISGAFFLNDNLSSQLSNAIGSFFMLQPLADNIFSIRIQEVKLMNLIETYDFNK